MTGGLAYGETEIISQSSLSGKALPTNVSSRNTNTGFTVGGGIETRLWGNWTARAEYLYLDLRDEGTSTAIPNNNNTHVGSVEFRDHIVRAGVNYKLSDPGARYYTKAAPTEQVYSWTGLYVGVNVGYGVTHSETVNNIAFTTEPSPPFAGHSSPLSAEGGIGGGQIGYNWQFAPTWVFGVEADIQGADQRGTSFNREEFFDLESSVESRLRWFGTVRGRLGWTATPSTLLYLTGGFAYGETELKLISFRTMPSRISTNVSSRNTNTGFTVGGGIETRLWGNWTARAEYLYLDLGDEAASSVIPDLASGRFTNVGSVDFRDHIFRAGLNYKLY